MSEPKLSERLQDRYDDDPPDTTVWGWFVENERKEISVLEAENASLRKRLETSSFTYYRKYLAQCFEASGHTYDPEHTNAGDVALVVGKEFVALHKRVERLEFAARQALMAIEEGYDVPKIRDDLHEALAEEKS